MIYQYNKLNGVPLGYFYIVHILSFGDFEVPYEYEILYYSENEKLLIEFCKLNNYNINPSNGWREYEIRKRVE